MNGVDGVDRVQCINFIDAVGRPGLGASVRDEVRDVDGSDVVAAAGAGPSTT